MTTLRKKREFKKSLKKENNKASQKKLRKRSKNRISKKKKLVAGSNFDMVSSPARDRYENKDRPKKQIFEHLSSVGQNFVNEYNREKKLAPNQFRSLKIHDDGTRISDRDGSVYLEILIFTSGEYHQLFHYSDHPGPSKKGCGAVHIKQFYSFDGLIQYDPPICFKINVPEDEQKIYVSENSTNNSPDVNQLNNFLGKIDPFYVGLFNRITKKRMEEHNNLQEQEQPLLRQSAPYTPVGQGIQSPNPSLSTETHTGLTPNIKRLKF